MSAIQPVRDSITSRDIAGMVESRHDDVMRSIKRLASGRVIQNTPPADFINPSGVAGQEYIFTGEQGKRDSIVVIAHLSPMTTPQLIDRWQEIEMRMASHSDPIELVGAPSTITQGVVTYHPAKSIISGVEYHLTRADIAPPKKSSTSLLPVLKSMVVGGSVFIDGVTYSDPPINGSRVQASRLGIKIRSRQEGTGVRIWRTA